MKIVVDMNLSPRWAKFLADAGYEAVHWSQVGPGDASIDQHLMGWAAEQDHVVLSRDLDLAAILAATRNRKPSVVQLRSDVATADAIGAAVPRAIRQTHEELRNGAILSIDVTRARLRVLPLGE